jgi:hypothetical protein
MLQAEDVTLETEDNTNDRRDHIQSAAELHHFSGVGGRGFQFRGARGY